MSEFFVVSHGEEQTLELGVQLGHGIDSPLLILLQGELGAGKSVLARGIARGLGVDPQTPITSPTFTLMNHYPARFDLYHFDLYRLDDPDELLEIGFAEFACGQGVAMVEWPERAGDENLPGLWVELRHAGMERRELRFWAVGAEAEAFLERFRVSREQNDQTTQ